MDWIFAFNILFVTEEDLALFSLKFFICKLCSSVLKEISTLLFASGPRCRLALQYGMLKVFQNAVPKS